MDTWGWTPGQIEAVVSMVSAFEYSDNLYITGGTRASHSHTTYEYPAIDQFNDWLRTNDIGDAVPLRETAWYKPTHGTEGVAWAPYPEKRYEHSHTEARSGVSLVTESTMRYRWQIRCNSSSGPGHTLGNHVNHKGNRRRQPYACWHAHRDVMLALFDANPEGRIKTALADYRGQANFYTDFPASNNGRSNGWSIYGVINCDCDDGHSNRDYI